MRGGSCRRLMPLAITSSWAARMPKSLSVAIELETVGALHQEAFRRLS